MMPTSSGREALATGPSTDVLGTEHRLCDYAQHGCREGLRAVDTRTMVHDPPVNRCYSLAGKTDGLWHGTGINLPIPHRHAERSSYTSNDLTVAVPPSLTSCGDVLSSGGIIPATR